MMTIAENIFRAELKWGRKFLQTVTFACICSERINEINESETFLFVCMFTQPDYSNFRGQEGQPLYRAALRMSTSAAADEVIFLVLFVADININVRQPSAEMNRFIEVATVNPYLVDMFLDKFFCGSTCLHQSTLSASQSATVNNKVSILATKHPFSGTALLSSNEEAVRNGSLKNSRSFFNVGSCGQLVIQTAVEHNGSYDSLHGMYELCQNGESPSSLVNSLGTK